METEAQLKMGEKGAWLSIFAYIFLAIVKLVIGHFGQSEGLMADGLNNTTDVVSSIAILIGLRISQKPPDENHSYGHYRAESIASLIAAFIMLTVGIQVIIDGVESFFSNQTETPDMLTAWTALTCAMIMYFVYLYNLKLGRIINSPSIKAAAYDNRSDAFVSIGAFIGIIGTQFGFPFLDTIAAIIVGVIICKTAWDIFRDNAHTLTDGIDTALLSGIEQTIIEAPGVLKVSTVKARTQGNQILVEATISVDPDLNVVESHEITENIEEQLDKKHRVSIVMIHIEPYQTETG
ncbi:cation diffusion facilitator family transporter [Bacillus benzoevorans]|uniref:Cation diffusion facilitator family transporter n=1 Tax=Bacillus benzoevorans TaxID=1456 RepID=A0A7X0HQ27_9BACI|nr:cation diffusion facilitator family transporter [Bacillus benzoevorans]MBB6443451.1 cation diffusion facilitator family transporter [Bacillus benzoevorans]